jgi:segregation and condensation protein A
VNSGPTIQLPVFEGPFDLLLHLIRENEVDIYDIPIAEITAQYIGYLQAMEALDMEIASSFLVMAATLLAIKAKMLLPPAEAGEEEGEPEDARAELVQDLLEYLHFKEAAGQLQGLRERASLQHSRPNAEELYLSLFAPENPLSGKTLRDLSLAFAAVLTKLPRGQDLLDIGREQVTIQDKTRDILAALKSRPRGLPFSQIFTACLSKAECVTAFLALLELIRLLKVRISQSGIYDDIYLYRSQTREARCEKSEDRRRGGPYRSQTREARGQT